jgi:hypothetical protein
VTDKDKDTVHTRTVYTRESSSTGWFVGIIVALALLAIGYLVFTANSGPSIPLLDERLVGAEVVTVDPKKGPTLAKTDGSCVQIVRTSNGWGQVNAECP